MYVCSPCTSVVFVAAWLALAAEPGAARQATPQVPGRELPATTTSEGARRVFFELRLAETEPVRGLTFQATVKPSGKTIHLHYTVVVTNNDVLRADVAEINGRYNVGVVLRPEGTVKLAEATTRHSGRPLGIVLDGEVVAVLTVQNPRRIDIVFGGDFTREEATRIATGLNKW
jgi:preprotein translocase subunit SecD